MKKKWITAACLAVAFALLPGISVASADSSCSTGHVCVWTELGFTGTKGETLCSVGGLHKFEGTKHSGKNECANRAVWFRHDGETVFCSEPKLWIAQFNKVDEIWVGAEGSHC